MNKELIKKTADYEKIVLDNGLTLSVNYQDLPYFHITPLIKYGRAYEPDELAGSAHFTDHLFSRIGDEKKNKDFEYNFESIAGRGSNAHTKYELMDVGGIYSIFPEDLDTFMDMIFYGISNKYLDLNDFENEKKIIIEEARAYEEGEANKLNNIIREKLWPNHVYSKPIGGYIREIEKITPGKIQKTREYFGARNIFIGILGPINKSTINKIESFSNNISSGKKLPKIQNPIDIESGEIYREFPEAGPGIVEVVYRVSGYSDKDIFPISIMSDYLGMGPNSRLYQILREQNPLCYNPFASFHSFSKGGELCLGAERINKVNKDKVIPLIDQEIERLKQGDIETRELERLQKNMLKNVYNLCVENHASKIDTINTRELLNIPNIKEEIEIYSSITKDDVQRVAEKYLDHKRLIVMKFTPD